MNKNNVNSLTIKQPKKQKYVNHIQVKSESNNSPCYSLITSHKPHNVVLALQDSLYTEIHDMDCYSTGTTISSKTRTLKMLHEPLLFTTYEHL
jgi:hypothetical protein